MEKDLVNVAKEVVQKPDVKGYLCTDQNGLCIISEGVEASPNLSGLISSIASLGKELEPDKAPIIQIGTSAGTILIHGKEGVTTAIFKSH